MFGYVNGAIPFYSLKANSFQLFFFFFLLATNVSLSLYWPYRSFQFLLNCSFAICSMIFRVCLTVALDKSIVFVITCIRFDDDDDDLFISLQLY